MNSLIKTLQFAGKLLLGVIGTIILVRVTLLLVALFLPFFLVSSAISYSVLSIVLIAYLGFRLWRYCLS